MRVLGTVGLAQPVVLDERAAWPRSEPGTVVYVITSPRARRRAREEAHRLGFRPAGSFLHLPDVERSTAIAALEGGAAAFLLGGMLERGGLKRRLVHGLLRAPGGAAAAERLLPNVGLAFTEDGTRAGAWLGEGSALVTGSWRAGAPVVVLLVRGGAVERVVKVHEEVAALEPEAAALRELAPVAAEAGAGVPELVSYDGRVLVQSGVRGRPARLVLRVHPEALGATLSGLAGWLDRWGRATRAESGAGVRVAAHNDVTMANVLLGGPRPVGVVDWGGAVSAGLPLADFAYAAADAVSARDGHADRVAAFRCAFVEDTPEARLVLPHLRGLAAGLALERAAAEDAFRGCWEQHAANEAARGDEGDAFRRIAGLARQTEVFR
jgi:Ser/Thr protein kinase RdoA (MazF antagonist)